MDRLQKEVIALRKICESEDGIIMPKNDESNVSFISSTIKKPYLIS